MKSLANGFAFLLGLVLIVQGIWECLNPMILGIFSGNATHGIIHILLGLVGLWAGITSHASGYLTFIGVLLCVVSGLWFLPATHDLIVSLLNINTAVTTLNLIVSALSLLIAFASRLTSVEAGDRPLN